MSALHEILGYYGMPEENIESAVEQIAETYGACRYLDGVNDGAEAVNELGIQETKENKEHIYSLELTKRQAELLSYACDQFSRLIIGQDWSYQELFEAAWEKRCKEAIGGHGMDKEWYGVPVQETIAWLEKQANIPHFTFDDILALQCAMKATEKADNELYEQLKSLHDRLHDAYWIEKQGEQKPWSEEDEKMFQYVLECYSGHVFASESEIETLKLNAKSLLDLARKEIEEGAVEFAKSYMEDVNPSFEKVQESEELWKWKMSCLRGINKAYTQGKQDALKSLPKWKKANDNLKLNAIVPHLLDNVLYWKGYYIWMKDLETLQKEE